MWIFSGHGSVSLGPSVEGPGHIVLRASDVNDLLVLLGRHVQGEPEADPDVKGYWRITVPRQVAVEAIGEAVENVTFEPILRKVTMEPPLPPMDPDVASYLLD